MIISFENNEEELINSVLSALEIGRKTHKVEETNLSSNLVFEDMLVLIDTREVLRHNQKINLTYTEFEILQLLAQNPGKVFSKEQIYDIVWKEPYSGDYNIVMCGIIESSQKAAYRAVNTTLIQRNWLLGYRIASEGLQGEDRAKYGAEIIKKLAKELSAEYGKGYTKSNLYSFYSFYKTYPEIFQTPSGKSVGLLSWSHYAALLQVKDKAARDWYEKEATEQTWSVRALQRNISSQYYYRMLKTQKKELVESEMKELTAPYQNDKLEFIKNPVVAEFLGFSQNTDFTESDLEKSILSNLQKFLMELGKGYAFVAIE